MVFTLLTAVLLRSKDDRVKVIDLIKAATH